MATVRTIIPKHAFDQVQLAQTNSDGLRFELEPTIVVIPTMADIAGLDAALFTRICVFGRYWLKDYESQITLPHKCHELSPLAGGERYRVSYHLGSYPEFHIERLNSK